jgi:hypothetical protein
MIFLDSRVSALGTKNRITPFSDARVAISTSSSFSFLRMRDGKESPMSIRSILGSSSGSALSGSRTSPPFACRRKKSDQLASITPVFREEKMHFLRRPFLDVRICCGSIICISFRTGFGLFFLSFDLRSRRNSCGAPWVGFITSRRNVSHLGTSKGVLGCRYVKGVSHFNRNYF